MKSLSPYIAKNLKKIEAAGYSVDQNGSQLHKSFGSFEVLMTDLTTKGHSTVKTILVWIKNTEYGIIEKEKFFRHEIMPLPFSKINSFVEATIADLNKQPRRTEFTRSRFIVKDLIHDVSL